jgi:pimeloyl-ACP methyl ester carboxylesterase
MPQVTTTDGVTLYYEETGTGTPVVFVHEFAGDYRTWEPQMRHFGRSHRCVTFSARGYPPSDVPEDAHAYGQARACQDVVDLMDALKIPKAHVVGHSMGAYTALHMGIRHPERCISVVAAGCGWGSNPGERAAARQACQDIAKLFREQPIEAAAKQYAHAPMRLTYKAKDPRGFAAFAAMLAEHSGPGSAMTMLNLQMERPTLPELEAELKRFSVPLLVIVGDEDGPCLDGSVFLKKTVPTAALLVVPRTGHTITSEEPETFNRAVAQLFQDAESGNWLTFKRYLQE